MRIGFLRRGTAAAAPEETVLRRIPDLPPDWVQPPAYPAHRALEDAAVGLNLAPSAPARAEECGRWKRAKAHDPHTWDHRDHGRVACPGYRPLTEET